ncbi:MAG: AMP-binding protein [Neisseriaceae bacterium]|nr:AMP-binding protein [Neisseriaceae bacterium]
MTHPSHRLITRWADLPEYFNIAESCCDRWAAEPERVAIIQKNADGSVHHYTFLALQQQANRLANSLRQQGIRPGDRIGIMLPQRFETAVAHMAIYKLGAIAVPLFKLFGIDAIQHRASNSAMGVLITDGDGLAKIEAIWADLPALGVCYIVGQDASNGRALSYESELAQHVDTFTNHPTRAEDPALIIYTSGTTGHPKGALHAQRILLGHLPGVRASHEGFPQPGDLTWTPADWAWIGGLLDLLLPSLYHGVPVVAYRAEKFNAEDIFQLLQDLGIRNVFFPPTALKMLRTVAHPEQRWQLTLRTVASGGESLGTELLSWGDQALGIRMNEFYGQTECNLVLSSWASQGIYREGAIGKAVNGFELAILDDAGAELGPDEPGHLAVACPNISQMLLYWDNPQATQDKYSGRWLITGDTAKIDADGYVYFVGREDDVITSAGYRIGPTPIEDCLLKHPAVNMVAVIGKKDPLRTELVKAFVVLNNGFAPGPETISDLQNHVRTQLANHEYPREIEFIDALPMTTTGKIIRGALRARDTQTREETV